MRQNRARTIAGERKKSEAAGIGVRRWAALFRTALRFGTSPASSVPPNPEIAVASDDEFDRRESVDSVHAGKRGEAAHSKAGAMAGGGGQSAIAAMHGPDNPKSVKAVPFIGILFRRLDCLQAILQQLDPLIKRGDKARGEGGRHPAETKDRAQKRTGCCHEGKAEL